MRPKEVPPSLASDSFRCPRCGALAHQTWFKVYAERFQGDDKPSIIDRKMVEQIKQDEKTPPSVVTMLERMSLKQPILHSTGDRRAYTNLLIENAYLSHCYSCDGITIWVSDNIVDPIHIDEIEPNEDIPPEVLVDFREASSIVSRSPRGAAALLRLAIQKLMPHLELPGKNLNEDIGTLVGRGLDIRIQQALDVVRVVGNHAVHPGQIDLRDDKATALRLFDLVNIIVESMISSRKHIEEMYARLPDGAKKQIAERDKNNGT